MSERPYPEGVEFDEAWRQRQRADHAESAVREWHKWIHSEIAKRSDSSEPQDVVNYNKHVVFGLKLSLAAMKDAVNQGVSTRWQVRTEFRHADCIWTNPKQSSSHFDTE